MQNISKKLLFGLGTCFLLYFANSSTTYASTLNCATATNINIPVSECQALLALYDSTNGASWANNTNRDTDTDVATRDGIIVAGGNVTQVSLVSNNLSGTLPESLSGLVFLEYLEMQDNNISGPLPSSRSSWTNMQYFQIGGNNISGPLPSSRSSWTSIYAFGITTNNISGPLPSSRSSWTNMQDFAAGDNQISGPLPSSRSSWSLMTYFEVGDNNISGPLPSSRSSWTSIGTFIIAANQIDGTLPSSRSSWTSIGAFYIENNLVSGSIPSSWYPARPDLGSTYIQSNNNCMQTTGYSVGMQSWLDTNAIYSPQNNCSTPPATPLCVGTGNSCTDSLIINVTLLAGDVCIGSSGTFDFGSYMVSSSLQTVTGAFVGNGGYFFVDDLKGADSGYYTTVQISGDLVGPNAAVISGVNVRMSTAAQGNAGITLLAGMSNSLVEIHAGMASYQSLDLARQLITRDTAANYGVIGKYGVLPLMELDIPAYQPVGSYSGTLVYTLYLN